MNVIKVSKALLKLDPDRVGRTLKRRWMGKTFPDGMHYRDEMARFDQLYLIPDPWSMNCERERLRFREINRLILENFGHPHTLLEIGCGEGLQSSEMQHVCDYLYGIDVSRRAVRRAQHRCPQATFAVGDIYTLPQPMVLTRFHLVTACEVLYYVKDVASMLKRMGDLGQACLVSYYHGPQREVMDKHVMAIQGVQSEIICCEDVNYTLAWFRP